MEYFDFSVCDFYFAPLKTLSSNYYVEIYNDLIKNFRNGYVQNLSPYLQNKITYMKRPVNKGNIISEFLTAVDRPIGALETTPPIGCGATPRLLNIESGLTPAPNFIHQKVYSPVYYYEYKRMPSLQIQGQNWYIAKPYIIGMPRDNKDNNKSANYGGILGVECKVIGEDSSNFANVEPLNPNPDPLTDDWIIITKFQLYDGTETAPTPRKKIGGESFPGENDGTGFVAPVVPFTGNGYITVNCSDFGGRGIGKINDRSFGNAVFAFNPAGSAWNNTDAYGIRPFSDLSLWSLCGAWYGGLKLGDINYRNRNYFGKTDFQKIGQERSPENMQLVVCLPNTLNENFTEMFWSTNSYHSNVFAKVSNGIHQTYIAFKSKEYFESLCADFGIKVSDNLEMITNSPEDLFPTPPDITVPEPNLPATGFPTNPSITNPPSYPDNTTDIIPLNPPNITPMSVCQTYALNYQEVRDVMNWLITDNYTSNISNLFNDKLSPINDLKLYPFDIVAHDSDHCEESSQLTICNVSTNIANSIIQMGYNTVIDGGQYFYSAYWGDFNDYDNVVYNLYVPYSGVIELPPSVVVNKQLKLKYVVDISTGNATAVIFSNDVIVKTCSAQLSISVPIIYSNTNQQRLNELLAYMSAGFGVTNGLASDIISGLSGGVAGGNTLSGIGGAVENIAKTAITNPLRFSHIGNLGGGTGLLLPQSAFLIISRQQIAMPNFAYKDISGIPSSYYGKTSDLVNSGFVSIKVDKLTTSATENEQVEIQSLLSSGIYI